MPICNLQFVILLVVAGCASLDRSATTSLPPLPTKKPVRIGQYVFISDIELKANEPLLKELEGLQDQICQELRLPPSPHVVNVYLFADRGRYERYMRAHFQDLPERRAFFMARGDARGGEELAVYTYWGDRIEEDLRHELTHALLHGVLAAVPLWLDEGLAEYFEVPPHWQGVNHRHLRALRDQPGIPWTPELVRLEKLTLVKEMSPADYREAWAWVHFMLHSTPEVKAMLTRYLHHFRQSPNAESIQPQLAAALPGLSPEAALRQHVTRLQESTRRLSSAP